MSRNKNVTSGLGIYPLDVLGHITKGTLKIACSLFSYSYSHKYIAHNNLLYFDVLAVHRLLYCKDYENIAWRYCLLRSNPVNNSNICKYVMAESLPNPEPETTTHCGAFNLLG